MVATPITAQAAYNALGTSVDAILAALAERRCGLTPVQQAGIDTAHWGRAPDPPPLPEPFAAFDSRATRLLCAVLPDLVGPVATARRRWGSDRLAFVLGVHGPDDSVFGPKAEAVSSATLQARGSQGPLLFAREALELRGPAYCVSAEGASGAAAIAAGHRLIEAGLADAVLAGGVGALSPLTVRTFAARRLLSAAPARPFAASRAGATIGEGAALVLIERHADAFVEICGVAEAQGATAGQDAATHAMRRALSRAQVEPSQVGFVQAQGSGLVTADFAEANAIQACFGESMPVSSILGATGWIVGAAGATEVAVAAAALAGGFIPASVSCTPMDGTLAVNPLDTRRELDSDYVLVHAPSLAGRSIALVVGARG